MSLALSPVKKIIFNFFLLFYLFRYQQARVTKSQGLLCKPYCRQECKNLKNNKFITNWFTTITRNLLIRCNFKSAKFPSQCKPNAWRALGSYNSEVPGVFLLSVVNEARRHVHKCLPNRFSAFDNSALCPPNCPIRRTYM